MQKTIGLSLNKFAAIPPSVRSAPTSNTVAEEISLDLARLYHHHFLRPGRRPPPWPHRGRRSSTHRRATAFAAPSPCPTAPVSRRRALPPSSGSRAWPWDVSA